MQSEALSAFVELSTSSSVHTQTFCWLFLKQGIGYVIGAAIWDLQMCITTGSILILYGLLAGGLDCNVVYCNVVYCNVV